ncbi:ArsR/SmtB family transcription factor [Pseudonocardia sp. TRM90224]|uniref:ArsR/SmtB family transcription factor n=1 Tax=Pseudonocardia sp. TRM90224 TaxID=2812678 RepID=UPI001E412CAD|nr:helix-turn-helix domain-containing protein [Pseudonocardia sp. TRM90224]
MDLLQSRIRLDPGAAVRVTFDPYTSVLALACAAARDRLQGADSELSKVAARFSERGLRAVARLVTPGASVGPDCLSPAELGRDTDVASELGRLRGLTAGELHTDFQLTYGSSMPAQWERVAAAPKTWVRDFADALESLWAVVEPVWRREAALRSREADRVGSAAVRRALDIVLAQAHPRGRTENGILHFPDPEGVDLDATGKVAVLAPVLSRLDVSISNLERPDLIWLAYPVVVKGRETSHEADPAALDALLTPVRARLLRGLEGEQPMSTIATRLSLGASATTHHVDALMAAGLVTRRRDGRSMLVSRGARGNELIDLYERA